MTELNHVSERALFDKFIKDTKSVDDRFFEKTDINDINIRGFWSDIFVVWLAPIGKENTSKDDFIAFAKSISYPVIDYDKNDLSWFGRSLYVVWKGSISAKR